MAKNPAVAQKLKARAAIELKAKSKIEAFEAAMKANDLKKAKLELDAVQSSTRHGQLKQQYEQAEAAAIRDLVTRLERAKEPDCKKYDQLVQQEKASRPPRVVAEATRQVKCTPASSGASAKQTPNEPELLRPNPGAPALPQPKSSPCNIEDIVDKAKSAYVEGMLAVALAGYEQAWACKQAPEYAEKAFIMACNIPNASKAKLHWSRMPVELRKRALMICVRNNISEDQLNAP